MPEPEWPQELRSIGWRNYGYQWWLAGAQADFFALGKDGQFLYVNPATQTVIVRLGWSTGDLPSRQWIDLFQTIAEATQE